MKKLAAMLSAFIMLFVNAFACGSMSSDILPSSSTETSVIADECTHWVIDSSSRELIGITDPTENVTLIRAYSGTVSYIRGVMSDGLIRVRGRAPIVISDGAVLGLTPVKGAKVAICPDYADTVTEIVTRRTGAELSYQTVIASTLWISCGTASHIFFTARHITFLVGYITVGSDTILLWAGDFDHNGDLELGFMAGTNDYYVAPTATPAPRDTKQPHKTAKPRCTSTPSTVIESKATCPPCGNTVDVFKLCFKFCITITKSVQEAVKDCGCK